jgi:hypothetical protein
VAAILFVPGPVFLVAATRIFSVVVARRHLGVFSVELGSLRTVVVWNGRLNLGTWNDESEMEVLKEDGKG